MGNINITNCASNHPPAAPPPSIQEACDLNCTQDEKGRSLWVDEENVTFLKSIHEKFKIYITFSTWFSIV